MAKIANIFNRNLNGLAKVHGLAMSRAGMTKRCMKQFNQTYDTVSYQSINRLLDEYGKASLDRVAEWEGQDVSHCGDNVDKRVKARHEMAGHSSLDLHMYNNLLYQPRIDTSNLSDEPPTVPDVKDIDLAQFILDSNEQANLKDYAQRMIARSWCSIDHLKSIVSSYSEEIPHEFTPEMSKKTVKVCLVDVLKVVRYHCDS